MLLLHGYLWWRLVRGTTRPGRGRRRWTLLVTVLALLPTLAVMLRGSLPAAVYPLLAWAGFLWLGLAFYTFLALLVTEPVRLVARLRRRSPAPAAAPARQEVLVPAGQDTAAPQEEVATGAPPPPFPAPPPAARGRAGAPRAGGARGGGPH